MDDFLSTSHGLHGTGDQEAPPPPSPGSESQTGSTRDSPPRGSLAKISVDLAAITANMMTRADKKDLVAELRATIREEITAVRSDLTALEQRVDDLEADRLQAA
ncbi:Hypothetical predicted protein [Pelobates cultripes]|uniref:Uncharacterized protein n=1 Tax=Pelobates cultripes TaxID=61616 RepID=A0AAD1WMC7_PELCU|nr:Hypothetical predicted protein [Pelobates cultripes]